MTAFQRWYGPAQRFRVRHFTVRVGGETVDVPEILFSRGRWSVFFIAPWFRVW